MPPPDPSASSTAVPTGPEPLLEASQAGDDEAFRRLVEPHRRELHAHCYRMLGSVQDAEDALQEASLRAWRALDRFEGRSSLRGWLYRIATNVCLSQIERRPPRTLPLDHGPATSPEDGPGRPLVETTWIEPYPDIEMGLTDGRAAPDARYEQRESVELAFVAAVQHLPVRQRAALILRDVLGFSAKEVAETVESSVASVNSALQRARETVQARTPQPSQQQTLRALGDDALRDLVARYSDAMERGDVETVVSMLTEDAAWSMPPLASWFGPRDQVVDFLRTGPLSGQWRWKHLPTTASGQPTAATYTWVEEAGAYLPFSLDVLTLRGDRIAEVTAFVTRRMESEDDAYYERWPDRKLDATRLGGLFAQFGLPVQLD